MKRNTLISIVGPTAVGKTKLAIQLAKAFNTEIISSDSRQFYRDISIGTAKPSAKELAEVQHHFINNLSIQDEYNASRFEKEVLDFLKEFFTKNKTAIMCGGSGLYVNAVLNGFDTEVPTADPILRVNLNKSYEEEGIEFLQEKLFEIDPDYFNEIDKNNSKRLLRAIEMTLLSGKTNSEIRKGIKRKRDFNVIKIGLYQERSQLYDKINRRVDLMMQEGLLDEVKSVKEYEGKNALNTVGYKELFAHLNQEMTLEQAIEKIKVNSRRYAKRQLTWFKRENDIEWFKAGDSTKIIEYIRKRFDDK